MILDPHKRIPDGVRTRARLSPRGLATLTVAALGVVGWSVTGLLADQLCRPAVNSGARTGTAATQNGLMNAGQTVAGLRTDGNGRKTHGGAVPGILRCLAKHGEGDCQPVPQPNEDCSDGDVDLRDFAKFQLCFEGANHTVPKDCRAHDFSADRDVDLKDLEVFQTSIANDGP